MENFESAVIPAKAGVPKHLMPRDSRLRGSDRNDMFFDTLQRGEGLLRTKDT